MPVKSLGSKVASEVFSFCKRVVCLALSIDEIVIFQSKPLHAAKARTRSDGRHLSIDRHRHLARRCVVLARNGRSCTSLRLSSVARPPPYWARVFAVRRDHLGHQVRSSGALRSWGPRRLCSRLPGHCLWSYPRGRHRRTNGGKAHRTAAAPHRPLRLCTLGIAARSARYRACRPRSRCVHRGMA